MKSRELGHALGRIAGPFPVVFLTGPRQSGKTTLARATFPRFHYASLEDPPSRDEALEDPRGFLARFEGADGIVIDEAQRAPDLFSYLQGFVDDRRAGPVILTGSQHFLLSARIGQSLAGRAAVLTLLPFSYAELVGRPQLAPADLLARRQPRGRTAPARDLDEILFSGMYPRIHDRGLDPAPWLDSYVQTYIERDVRTLTNVGDLGAFSRFLKLCAGRAGQLVNLSAIGADAGVDQSTVKRWLSLLSASYVVDLLPPYHRNFRKRVVKAPKLYFNDTGLLCNLLGIRGAEHLRHHPLRGAIFENFVVAEIRKVFFNAAERPPLAFFRDSRGAEVDIVLEGAGALLPIEAKSGRTVAGDFLEGLDRFAALSGCGGGALVYGGDETYERRGHLVCSWAACATGGAA
jgi:hypothetical protein